MNVPPPNYNEASVKTADNLRTIARSMMSMQVSQLTLPEVESLVEIVGKVAPAGNVPGLILNGLARITSRTPPANVVKRDVNLLFKGVEKALNTAVYGTFFAGPAAIIWGYQNILKLAGKDLATAFPEGTWQFYVDYALREDTARHSNETVGFDAVLKRHQIPLTAVNRLTAWAMTAINCLHQYDDLLANEWYERVALGTLEKVTEKEPEAAQYAQANRQWNDKRPYTRGQDADPSHNYAQYRRLKFQQFLDYITLDLRPNLRQAWQAAIEAARPEQAAYQKQMSILAYLQPDEYSETRVPIAKNQLHIGIIDQGRYYLIPACKPDTSEPADLETVRGQVAAILAQPTAVSTIPLSTLAKIQRAAFGTLSRNLNKNLQESIAKLRLAPIFINTEHRLAHQPLSEIRQTERGIGDHALTIFDTRESIVFDQSHIFFDGGWSASLAEILTREAIAWAVYVHNLPPIAPGNTHNVKPVSLPFDSSDRRLMDGAPKVTAEVSAETTAVKIQAITSLRKIFKQRNDLLNLTVNDLLIMYRAIHAVTYQPDPALITQLEELGKQRQYETAVKPALNYLHTTTHTNPAILIPVDATRYTPRERLYPLVFEVPLADLDLIDVYRRTVVALTQYENGVGDRTAVYQEFDNLQRTFLSVMAGFAEVLSKAKEVALKGESTSVRSIKLLAHMPPALQRMLDTIPSRFDVLNDLIKGDEVFSNVGVVARGSTLSRFSTAKDDNEKKSLAWGVLTDASGILHITLRDFRPHVGPLLAAGQKKLATAITQHYLESYAQGLNEFIQSLRRITLASRETRLVKPVEE